MVWCNLQSAKWSNDKFCLMNLELTESYTLWSMTHYFVKSQDMKDLWHQMILCHPGENRTEQTICQHFMWKNNTWIYTINRNIGKISISNESSLVSSIMFNGKDKVYSYFLVLRRWLVHLSQILESIIFVKLLHPVILYFCSADWFEWNVQNL